MGEINLTFQFKTAEKVFCHCCGKSSDAERLVRLGAMLEPKPLEEIEDWNTPETRRAFVCADCLRVAIAALALDVGGYRLKSEIEPGYIMSLPTLRRWAEVTREKRHD